MYWRGLVSRNTERDTRPARVKLLNGTSMKLKTFFVLFALSGSLMAAEPSQTEHRKNQPVDKHQDDLSVSPDGQQVTITTRKEETTIEEYRVGGKLYMIKVTPKHGKPYYLVDDLGDGRFARQEGLDSGVRVPRWVIKKF